ncbi:MAG: DnaB-like helicase C-terminal domain-containing protein [Desulfopila sp.]
METPIEHFYKEYFPEGVIEHNVLTVECPFCGNQADGQKGRISVVLNTSSFFCGYFRCSRLCVTGGYHHWFAHLAGIDPANVPGRVEDEMVWRKRTYPDHKIHGEIDGFQQKLACDDLEFFKKVNVGKNILQQLKIGYNGRYLVYPYFQVDGNVYSARCVHPENSDDSFWHGDAAFGAGPFGLFNVEEIQRCSGGALFLCEGEENLLIIKQLGFPGVAFFKRDLLEELDPEIFASVTTIFIVVKNTPESFGSARLAASRIGHKVRILQWSGYFPREYSLYRFAEDSTTQFPKKFGAMLVAAQPFSPFAAPQRENREFFAALQQRADVEYTAVQSGFARLDNRLGGIHGINIVGGGPKVGKSCFMTQIATDMARRKIPVLYYDFENGRQRLYQRTFARMARIETSRLYGDVLSGREQQRHDAVRQEFDALLRYFRVVNDRKVSPEIMRRHIDFLRNETRKQFTVVVIDSLHKLPFKDLRERRSGIDEWLRQMESIRDALNVSFLVVSELSRGEEGKYDSEPHMGIFKGSGDIEYSADNAMVLLPEWDHMATELQKRRNKLWLVGSREHAPGLVGDYILDYPYWGFYEEEGTAP